MIGQTLIVRWNGTAWKKVPSPSPAGSTLYGVAATSASNAWAVGCSNCSASGVYKTLILHWNGIGWKQVPSPTPAAGGSASPSRASARADSPSITAVPE